jgi:hypothetical protein
MASSHPMDRQAVYDDYERARQTFHCLLEMASEADLGRLTHGTRWTNKQLLWHMLFGYMLVRALLILARVFDRLPRSVGKAFARMLNAATVPFHFINYLAPVGAVKVCGPRWMAATFDHVVASLRRRLAAESEADLADIYRYPTQHFDFHYRQLTLEDVG